jgi:aminopeptidase N
MKNNQNPKAIYLDDYQVPNYLISKTDLAFYLNEDFTEVHSTLQVNLNKKKEDTLPSLELNGVDLELKSITIDGQVLQQDQYQVNGDLLVIHPTKPQFELQIETIIKPQENTALEGLYISKGMYCTQCEAHGFRRITYYLDRPDVMSVFDVYIEADKSKYPILLSNGNPLGSGDLSNGRHWISWNDPHFKPCYLFALVAGDLEVVEDTFTRASGNPVALQLFVEKHDTDKCSYALESLKNAMRWDEQVFGREYDLDIYMIVAVNHFNMGAMENKGLNIFNTSCVLANKQTTTDSGFERVEGVVAHEYFHNWSGNRVTCRDWFQLSLKEGFTVFRDEEFSSDMGSRTVKRIDDVNVLRSFQFKEDAGPMAHPIRPASYIEMNNFYTATVYNKGAEVVRMQHTLLGAQQFRKACDIYFDKFDGQAVTCDDFVSCMEQVSGKDLTQFKRWYSQAGTPVLSIEGNYNSEQKTFSLKVKQSCPDTPGQSNKLPFVIPVSLALFSKSGEKLSSSLAGNTNQEHLLIIDQASQDFVLSNVEEIPLPSFLRNFSAPVKLDYDYSKSDFANLMANDDDGFNAWDAGQSLFLKVLKELVLCFEKGNEPVFDLDLKNAIQQLLENKALDKALLARMLSLPSKSYLAEQYASIQVDAIIGAHNFLEQAIASAFYDLFRMLYLENCIDQEYMPNAQQIAQRSLKNLCLRYMALTNHEDAIALAEKQFENADNMTDQSAGFRALVFCEAEFAQPIREKAILSFYEQWKEEALVIDQWFSVQASTSRPSLIADVKALLKHQDFDFKNPNRVRSVLAVFAQNYEFFHQEDGEGYAFFAEQIKLLNKINPQIAARLVAALVHWRRYQGERGDLMKEQLEMLKALPDLSKDVDEIVERALQD